MFELILIHRIATIAKTLEKEREREREKSKQCSPFFCWAFFCRMNMSHQMFFVWVFQRILENTNRGQHNWIRRVSFAENPIPSHPTHPRPQTCQQLTIWSNESRVMIFEISFRFSIYDAQISCESIHLKFNFGRISWLLTYITSCSKVNWKISVLEEPLISINIFNRNS